MRCSAEWKNAGIKVRLVRQQKHLRQQLEMVDAAVEALNKNPEVAELLESVMRAL
jgi:uncharacterized protein with von Willebrand factor type A (vWA) domain